MLRYLQKVCTVLSTDHVLQNVHFLVCEDNKAVIKMIIEGGKPKHAVCLKNTVWTWIRCVAGDWSPATHVRYVNTKKQVADILTKSSVTFSQWTDLTQFINIHPTQSSDRSVHGHFKPLPNHLSHVAVDA